MFAKMRELAKVQTALDAGVWLYQFDTGTNGIWYRAMPPIGMRIDADWLATNQCPTAALAAAADALQLQPNEAIMALLTLAEAALAEEDARECWDMSESESIVGYLRVYDAYCKAKREYLAARATVRALFAPVHDEGREEDGDA